MLCRGDGSLAFPTDFAHQTTLVDETWLVDAFAVFWEMGVGKTRPTIQTAVRRFQRGDIDGVLVVAPDGVHRNWPTQELPAHCTIPWRALDWHSSINTTQRQQRDEYQLLQCAKGELPWLAITYDALKTDAGIGFARRFVKRYPRYMLVVDESSRAKNPTAKRTKIVQKVADGSKIRRILNGTPVSNSPLDVYSQMMILDPLYWKRRGIGTYSAFKARFCVMREITIGTTVDPSYLKVEAIPTSSDAAIADYEAMMDADDSVQLVQSDPLAVLPPATSDAVEDAPKSVGRTIKVIARYRELDKLRAMLEPSSSRLTKEEAGLNLPPKLYQRIPFELAPKQRAAYDTLRRTCMLELDTGALVTAPIALVKILRLHQIACGYLPNPDDPDGEPIMLCDPDNDPRFEHFMDYLGDVANQAIIWCRFTLDVDRICKVLGKEAARYDGMVTRAADRARAIDEFRGGEKRYFVAKPSAIGMGVTLVNTTNAIYYSNSYVLHDRLQSEDRCHRIGQHNAVTYGDMEAIDTVEGKIIKALREKKNVAAECVGDAYREWLQ